MKGVKKISKFALDQLMYWNIAMINPSNFNAVFPKHALTARI